MNDEPRVVFSEEKCCETCLLWMKPPVEQRDQRRGACAGRFGRISMHHSAVIFYEARYYDECCAGWTDDTETAKRFV